MAKATGLLSRFFVGGYNLSGDTSALDQIQGGPAVLDGTGLDKAAKERIFGLRDGSMAATTFFNAVAAAEHVALSALPRTDTIGTFMVGNVVGNPAASINAKQANYDPTRDTTGNLTEKTTLNANGFGLEWGIALTAGARTDATATAGAAVDNAASTTFGAQAYLHVTGFTGTSVDLKVEHSADNVSWSTLIDFGSVAAIGAFRGTAAGTVSRYVRATSGTGTFSSVTFMVSFMRNPIVVVF
jgi:hypothetical protein